MDATHYQASVMAELGETLTDAQLQRAFSALITDASAVRTLVGFDRDGDLIDDRALTGHVGALLRHLAVAACVLGVDLGEAMAWGERAGRATREHGDGDDRLVSVVAR